MTEHIEDIIKSVFKTLSKAPNPTSDEISKIWRETAGKKAAAHSRPASLAKKRLVVDVDGSSWLYELTLNRKKLLAGLKKKLGEDKIKELQFRIGEM